MARTIDRLANSGEMIVAITGQTSHGTGGTRSTHTHGLRDHVGAKITPTVIIPVVTAADADGSVSAASVFVVSADEDEVTVRASASSVTFDLYVT